MGPEATLVFLEKFYALTRSHREQDRPGLLLDMEPAVPDRNAAWRGSGPSPGEALLAMGRRLARAGADFCVMPCVTAHGFAADFEREAGIRLLRLPDVVADALAAGRHTRPGLLATTTTLDMGLFGEALAARGIRDAVVPGAADQDALMRTIYAIKRGADVRADVLDMAERLVARGADVVLVGCTDLSTLHLTEARGSPVVDALDLLARRTFEEAGCAPD